VKVSLDANRPIWINSDVPVGAQADQFLHAHYYERTFDGQHAKYEEHFDRNRNDPDSAILEALSWWHNLKAPTSSEAVTRNEWAPLLHTMLSADRISMLSETDLVEVFMRVHALRDHARRVENKVVGLPDSRHYTTEEKAAALARYVFRTRSAQGLSVLDVLNYVLYGGSAYNLAGRLWEAIASSRYKIDHLGISAVGEIEPVRKSVCGA
jgi:hypothetical protein